jgi:hypothetical protein
MCVFRIGFVLADVIICRILLPMCTLQSGLGLEFFKIVSTSNFVNGVDVLIGSTNIVVFVHVDVFVV